MKGTKVQTLGAFYYFVCNGNTGSYMYLQYEIAGVQHVNWHGNKTVFDCSSLKSLGSNDELHCNV